MNMVASKIVQKVEIALLYDAGEKSHIMQCPIVTLHEAQIP